jgi:hypothetical protein
MADVVRSDGEFISRGLSEAGIERLTRMLRKLLATLEPGGDDARADIANPARSTRSGTPIASRTSRPDGGSG